MNKLSLTLLSTVALAASATAQFSPNFLLTYSQPENNTSGSGGTVLRHLFPNEISYLDFFTANCVTASAEKWLPRTASHTMAGDENGDGFYWNPNIYGKIDALLNNPLAATPVVGTANQRTVYWSVSQPLGNFISASPFRPGDIARIVRQGFVDGQVDYFMKQEAFQLALGLPFATPIDIDAIAFQPNFGVWFSIDVDTPCLTACGPTLVQDGDVLCIPPAALMFGPGGQIAGVMPNSAVVVHNEAQMDFFTMNAQVSDRFGACINNVVDVEALEIDLFGPVMPFTTCTGGVLSVPTLLYACETGTGASLLTTQGGGQIHNTPCWPAGTPCGGGPTFGPQMGIRPASATVGAASHINAIASARVCRHVLEPQQHVVTAPGGAPAGFTGIDYASDFPLNVVLIDLAPAGIAPSFPAAPFSPTCFPDLYAPSLIIHAVVPGTWGSVPMIGIPPLWSGKILFQSIGLGAPVFELSTPAIMDIN